MKNSREILLFAPNWLGDVIMAQPAMRAIAQAFPECALWLYGRPWLADLLPFLNLGAARYAPRPFRADMAYLFRNSFSAAWQAWRSRTPVRHGFAHDARSLLLRPAYRPRLDMRHAHHRRYFLDLVRQSGIEVDADAAVSLRSPAEQREQGLALLRRQGLAPERCICVAPGAQFGGSKRYPDDAYRAVLRDLAREAWQPVVLGTSEEREIADSCLREVKGKAWNACGQTTLRQALQLLAASRLLLCNDSGLMHAAAGMGVPVVTIFGATDPRRTAPSGMFVHLLYRPAPCSPCLRRECQVAGHPCMRAVAAEEVRDACLRALT